MPAAIGGGSVPDPKERARSSVRFDIFELDLRDSQLHRSGLPVDLPPQALRILTYLVDHANEVVSRKEIQAVLWPNQSHGDFDGRLNFAVRKLREALRDDAENPRYIQTVRNTGYRFIAPIHESIAASLEAAKSVTVEAGGAVSKPNPVVPTSTAQKGLRHRLPMLVVVFLAVMTTVVTTSFALRWGAFRGLLGHSQTQPAGPGIEFEPRIFSVTPILPAAGQKIVIKGRGFGFHTPYARTDSPYLAIRDKTANWASGRIIPQNWDEIMLDVGSWTDTEIVVSGFSGSYGLRGWKLTAGDELEIAIWNPQSGAGPALYPAKVISEQSQLQKTLAITSRIGDGLASQPPVITAVCPYPLVAPLAMNSGKFYGTLVITGQNFKGGTIETNGPLSLLGDSSVNSAGTIISRSYHVGCCAPQDKEVFRFFVRNANGSASAEDKIALSSAPGPSCPLRSAN
jgi:DNA-binding winged helix-turn-helix (wHTH) protein